MRRSAVVFFEWVGSLPKGDVSTVPAHWGVSETKPRATHTADYATLGYFKELIEVGVVMKGKKDFGMRRHVMDTALRGFKMKVEEGVAGPMVLKYLARIAGVYSDSYFARNLMEVAEKGGVERTVSVWRHLIEAHKLEPEAAQMLLKKMLEQNITPDTHIFNALLSTTKRLGYRKCESIWTTMWERRIHPNQKSFKELLKSCKTKEEMKLCISLVGTKSKVVMMKIPQPQYALTSIRVAESVEEVKELFLKAVHRKEEIPSELYDAFLSIKLMTLAKLNAFKEFSFSAATDAPTPRTTTYYLSVLQSLQIFILESSHATACDVYLPVAKLAYCQATSSSLPPSPHTYSTMLTIYERVSNKRSAILVLEDMRSSGLRVSSAMQKRVREGWRAGYKAAKK